MKKLVTVFLSMLFLSCNASAEANTVVFESVVKITDFDRGACACCGGWFIEIDGNQNFYRFDALPQSSNIDLFNSTFPIFVNLNWSEVNATCRMIDIEDIELKQ